ncbi:MAG: hypothetical protein H0X64_06435 [Gemmatimonadaceae bacterium]|nr:hypothetical protein [Gemmatimonadaceae bacterium]
MGAVSSFWVGVLVGGYVCSCLTAIVISALIVSGRQSRLEDVEADRRAWLDRELDDSWEHA